MFQILSLTFPVIWDRKSKTKGAAVSEFYFTFINIMRPRTYALMRDTNLTSYL